MVLVVLPTAGTTVRQKQAATSASKYTPRDTSASNDTLGDPYTPQKHVKFNLTSAQGSKLHDPILEIAKMPNGMVAANRPDALHSYAQSFVEVHACREQPSRLTNCVMKHHPKLLMCIGVLLLLCIICVALCRQVPATRPEKTVNITIPALQLAGYSLFDTNLDASGAQGQAIFTDEEKAFTTEMIQFSDVISDSTRHGIFIKVTPMEEPRLAKILDNATPHALRRWRYSRLTWWSSLKSYSNREMPVDSLAIYQVTGIAQLHDKPTDVQVQFTNDLLSPPPTDSQSCKIGRSRTLNLFFYSPLCAVRFCKAMDNLIVAMREQFGTRIIPNPELADECIPTKEPAGECAQPK